MKIYNYHRDTGEFINESIANESPLEPGIYLIPANATEIKPPTVSANEAAVFVDGWQILPDFRGADAWNFATRQKVEIVEIGKTLDDLGLVGEEPQPTSEEIAQATLSALESAIDNFMDSKAQALGFKDRHSFALRAGIAGSSWHSKAQIFGAWMDSVNDYCYQVKLDCQDGKRTVPTEAELLAELPTLTL